MWNTDKNTDIENVSKKNNNPNSMDADREQKDFEEYESNFSPDDFEEE